VTKFTAQLVIKSCAFNVFATFAEHPPHRIPSIEYSLVFVAAAVAADDDDDDVDDCSSEAGVLEGGVEVLNAAKRVANIVFLPLPSVGTFEKEFR
jgi:hypothetical protein